MSGHKREGKNKLLNGKQSFRSMFFYMWTDLVLSGYFFGLLSKVTESYREKSVCLFIKADAIQGDVMMTKFIIKFLVISQSSVKTNISILSLSA